MGWTESPGYFCAATETGRNILQALMDAKVQLPPHQFNSFITPATPARRQTSARSTRSWQIPAVYVDVVFDTQARMVHLTQRRKALGITNATTRLLKKVSTQKLQSVVGKQMRHVATILPSARALLVPC